MICCPASGNSGSVESGGGGASDELGVSPFLQAVDERFVEGTGTVVICAGSDCIGLWRIRRRPQRWRQWWLQYKPRLGC